MRGRMRILPQRIPPHFVKHLVNEKAGRATRMDPYDDLWTIVLRKKENGTYLHDGWPNFMRYHSLGNREFLLFQYHGIGTLHNGKCLCRKKEAGQTKKDNVDPIERHLIEAGKDQIKLRQSESCKYALDAAPKEKRKQGRPRKNNVDSIELRLIEAEKDQINLHQLESCKYAPNAAPEEKRKRGRQRKNREIDILSPHQLESCKEDPGAASNRKRKRGRQRKNKDIDNLILHQLESCIQDPEATSSGKRKPGRARKKKDEDLLHQSKSFKYREATESKSKSTTLIIALKCSMALAQYCPLEKAVNIKVHATTSFTFISMKE
ncbi:hypothetical protein Acr_00g0065870 [Actinidia rufa]|uniref:TF-B3 domain-containing protein n=1 Tax=Actinidia rufa TaxID=165716 RepID=A0A7J0DQ63_9ERIC|nr:hypothetical protein Acr_00g0065870 [Actinidia rufa]